MPAANVAWSLMDLFGLPWWRLAAAALGVVILYELLRAAVVGGIVRAQERRVDRFLREHRIPTDPFRHTHRVVVKELVLADPGLVAAMAARASAHGSTVATVQEKVRAWLEEMVPQFNVLSYYQVGYRLARLVGYSTYNVRLDRASWERAQALLPPNACVVLVSNHRSSMDFIVTGFMVSKSVQVSYAVGEWARVWPLDRLFRSFGSYFVRRGEKDLLYHRTLEAYIQLVTKQGVTQAVFPEGGLSRDGKLRPVKLGLIDHMVRAKLDPAFTRPLVFVPVGINFDRVLEDEVLVRETVAGDHPLRRRTGAQKLVRLASMAGKGIVSLPVNLARFATKRLKKSGVCAIHFGDPLSVDDWLRRNGGPWLASDDRQERWKRLQSLGDEVMARIAQTVPATPVTVVAAACVAIGRPRMEQGVPSADMVASIRAKLRAFREAGTPLEVGSPYEQRRPEATATEELAGMEESIENVDEAMAVLSRALDVTQQRGLIRKEEGIVSTGRGRWELVEYYANSLPAAHPRAGAPATAIGAATTPAGGKGTLS